MLFGQREWLYLIRLACLETCLEAEEDEGPGDDVQQEGEADAEGGEEHGADGVTAPGGQNSKPVAILHHNFFYNFWNKSMFSLIFSYLLYIDTSDFRFGWKWGGSHHLALERLRKTSIYGFRFFWR